MPAAPVVLDSHALVAYFRDEPGAERVEALLTKAAQTDRPLHMTEVNYAEVKYILIRKNGPEAWEAAARMLVGLRGLGDKLPIAGADLFDSGQQMGMVTSSCMSPMLGNLPIGLGYVKKAYASPGKQVEVLAEGARVKVEVASLPLWTRHTEAPLESP